MAEADDEFLVTEAWVRAYGTSGIGWSAAQLRALGVAPQRGWLRRIVGTRIAVVRAQEFQRLGPSSRAAARPVPTGQVAPSPTGASRDRYLGRRATRPDYAAYVRWCAAEGLRPLAEEPLAYGVTGRAATAAFLHLGVV